jgi:hypothetical protein
VSDSEAELTLVLKAKNLASREVDKLHGSLLRARGGASALGGALVTLAKVGVAGLITGIVAVAGFLGVATKKAAEEQVGINRLNAALKANVKGFKGNTDAIEAVIKKREDLAFSDDELRASLAILVTKYKNVSEAQRIQAVAMDVARLKNISLADATSLVSKGMDGSAKVLKQLGIVLPKTATEQDRLTAIQKKAAGQAVAYGKTAEGAQKSFQIAIQDVVEDIGAGLIPIMTEAFTWLRTTGIPAVRGIIGAITKWITENKPLIDQIRNVLVKVIGMVIEKIQGVVGWIGKFVSTIAGNRDAMNVLRTIFQGIVEWIGLVWEGISRIITFIGNLVGAITSNKTAMKAFATGFDIIHTAVSAVVDALRWIVDNIGKVLNAIGSIKLPDVTGITNLIPHFAAGGRVPGPIGQPRLIVAHGGEQVQRSAYTGRDGASSSGAPGVTIRGVTERELVDMIDRGLYFRLQRSAPTLGRT